MSARWSTFEASRHCSGAMYAGVPSAMRVPVMSAGRALNPAFGPVEPVRRRPACPAS